jgi:hypothetical protein
VVFGLGVDTAIGGVAVDPGPRAFALIRRLVSAATMAAIRSWPLNFISGCVDPARPAWFPPFHSGNTSSNLVPDANKNNQLMLFP